MEHGFYRADTPERAKRRRDYLATVFSAILTEPFTKQMAQLAANIDANAKKNATVIPLRICSSASRLRSSASASALEMNVTSQ
jgi:hypothetical protein